MNRRDFLANSFFAAGLVASRAAISASAKSVDQPAIVVDVRTDHSIGSVPLDFMGLGYEISSVARPGLLSGGDSIYVQMVRTLGARGVIRIGGNTSDYSGYSPNAAAVSSPHGTIVNDAVLKDLGGFLDATGWSLIWGLNLGTGSEDEAVAEANAVLSVAGERMLAFEIGNEPDLFAHQKHRKAEYSYEDWLAEYRRYKKALRARFPRIALAGPDAAVKTDWVTRFASDEGKDAVLLTHHYYREGQNPSSTIEKLLGVDPKLQRQLDTMRAASRSCDVPYRICEVNSFSGGGRPGVSDTMAGALWALDYMFTLAANGCSGVNIETGVNQLGFLSSYSPIGESEQGHPIAKAEYYGMLAFSLAGHGDLLKTDIYASSPDIKAYAIRPGVRTPGNALTLTLINKGAGTSALTVNTGVKGEKASLMELTGPAIDAKTGITLGRAEVTSAGTWKPAKSDVLQLRNGQLNIKLAAASAAIVEIA
jgi:hypothetical protein